MLMMNQGVAPAKFKAAIVASLRIETIDVPQSPLTPTHRLSLARDSEQGERAA
jgi:hypothetical protein